MYIFNKIKDKLKFDAAPDLSRRKFIKNAGALAALTVIGSAVPSLFKVKEIQAQIDSGLVENQTFHLSEPIILDVTDVVFRNCEFIAVKPMIVMIVVEPNCKCTFQDCYFESLEIFDHYITFKQQAKNKASLCGLWFNKEKEYKNITVSPGYLDSISLRGK